MRSLTPFEKPTLSAYFLQLLSEWTDNFAYDFRYDTSISFIFLEIFVNIFDCKFNLLKRY